MLSKIYLSIISAVSLVVGNLGSGIKCADFENLSTTVKIMVLLSDAAKSVTKSREGLGVERDWNKEWIR